MGERFRIDPEAVYDDSALVLGLGVTYSAMARARRSGRIQFAREGKRVLYRGQWIIKWLEAGGTRSAADGKGVPDAR